MKSKIEKQLDAEFEKMDVKPHVYHFTSDVAPFIAVTIVDKCKVPIGCGAEAWHNMRDAMDNVFMYKNLWLGSVPATRLIQGLNLIQIYGVAICNKRDQFNRQRGRIIGKGRLLKHLKEEIQK